MSICFLTISLSPFRRIMCEHLSFFTTINPILFTSFFTTSTNPIVSSNLLKIFIPVFFYPNLDARLTDVQVPILHRFMRIKIDQCFFLLANFAFLHKSYKMDATPILKRNLILVIFKFNIGSRGNFCRHSFCSAGCRCVFVFTPVGCVTAIPSNCLVQ